METIGEAVMQEMVTLVRAATVVGPPILWPPAGTYLRAVAGQHRQ